MLDGWSGPESWGIWAEGTEARALWLTDRLEEPLFLELVAFPFCQPGKIQRLEVFLNGSSLGAETFPDCQERTIRWRIPGGWARGFMNWFSGSPMPLLRGRGMRARWRSDFAGSGSRTADGGRESASGA